MLHTVNKSPFERNALDSCFAIALKGSAVLLFEDAVYAALKGTAVADKVAGKLGEVDIYVLGPDLAARGMAEDRVIDGIKVVDYGGFVDLAAENGTVTAWM